MRPRRRTTDGQNEAGVKEAVRLARPPSIPSLSGRGQGGCLARDKIRAFSGADCLARVARKQREPVIRSASRVPASHRRRGGAERNEDQRQGLVSDDPISDCSPRHRSASTRTSGRGAAAAAWKRGLAALQCPHLTGATGSVMARGGGREGGRMSAYRHPRWLVTASAIECKAVPAIPTASLTVPGTRYGW